eukprot:scaffold61196_cov46-Prasinocladus_malaysianus.AAC.1
MSQSLRIRIARNNTSQRLLIDTSSNLSRASSEMSQSSGFAEAQPGNASPDRRPNHDSAEPSTPGEPHFKSKLRASGDSLKKITISDYKTPVLRKVNSPKHGSNSSAFPCFRPVDQRKTVHVIRHGESEYNAADKTNTSWNDPLIFDPHLTAVGRQQATALRAELEKMPELEDAVWMVSPLTRAIETFLLACPFTERLRAAARGEQVLEKLPQVVICPEMHEHCMTAGDIGRPASRLKQDFPELAKELGQLPEIWWYTNEHHDNCALSK